MPALLDMVAQVKVLGLETCMTLGMLSSNQAQCLAAAGLDYYNHNIDTAPEFYGRIVGTHDYQDRLDTLEHVRDSGMKLCCGGILGMGEGRAERIGFLHILATLPVQPQSVPLNALVRIAGTTLGNSLADVAQGEVDEIEFVRAVAVARILMPRSMLRPSAGRERMSETMQALCFLAGANSIFIGDKLLTAPNVGDIKDAALLDKLGLRPMQSGSRFNDASWQIKGRKI